MKAAQINMYGGSEVVQINSNVPESKPAKGQLLVEVYAAGVNPSDWKIREGYMSKYMLLPFPATLGGDFSGRVQEVGEGVSGFAKGDEVYGQADIAHGLGSFADFSLANATSVATKPKRINHVEAAALPLAGVSAWQAIVEHMQLAKDQKILIHGGAGGIGSFAIQIAKHLGAYVATTSSADDTQYVKELGADEVIDYKSQLFEELIADFDAVFDTVGGETYNRSFKVLKKGGVLLSMVQSPKEDLAKQYGVKAMVQASLVTSERLTKLSDLVEQGVIKVHIDKAFSLDQAAQALEYLKTAHPRGKVVIVVKSKTEKPKQKTTTKNQKLQNGTFRFYAVV